MSHVKSLLSPYLIFFLIFFVHFFSKVNYITDSRWTLHSCWAMIHHHDLRLDDFKDPIEKFHYYAIDVVDGHLYYSFPPGTPILCTPFFWVMDQFAIHFYGTNVFDNLRDYNFQWMELFLAAFFTALTAVALYFVLKQFQIREWLVWLLIFVFGFGTSAWTVASRGLAAHGPCMLFLTCTIWALNNSEKNKNWLWLAGFLCGYSYIIRPTNSFALIVFGLYVLYKYRFQFFKFFVPASGVIILFFIYNFSVYGSLLTPYYSPSHMGSENHLLRGLAGTLFSPNRGLFISSSFFLFLFPALLVSIRKKKLVPIHYAILVLVVLHALLISYFDNWYAGWCFGPRYFTDIIPLLIILLAPGLQEIFSNLQSIKLKTVFFSFLILSGISCFIHYKGANEVGTERWNYIPNVIDEHRERVWDWNDLQFLRKNEESHR